MSNLLPSFKSAYLNANSSALLIDDNYNTPPRAYISYWNQPQVFSRMVIADNYSGLISNISNLYTNNVGLVQAFNFTKNDYLGYDAEDWALTPSIEQNNQINYTQMACNYVHAAGYKFAYTPEIDVPGWGQFAQINWTCVDLLDLQEQFNSGDPTALIQNVTQLLSVAKAQNPNLVVFVQIDMTGISQSTLESDILALAGTQGVNGVMIEDNCSTSGCNSTLAILINCTKTISCTGSNSTNTTTSTTSTILTTFTTTAPSSGSGGGGGGVGGGTGGVIESQFLPSVIIYANGNQTGYEITNFSQMNSEALTINNNTFHVTENYISPTCSGVTINSSITNQSYDLTPNNPVVMTDPNNYTYYIELANISYLPIAQTITLLIYKQPTITATTTTSTITISSTTSSSTVLSTTTSPITTTSTPTSTSTAPQISTTSLNTPLMGVTFGLSIVTCIAYSRSARRKIYA